MKNSILLAVLFLLNMNLIYAQPEDCPLMDCLCEGDLTEIQFYFLAEEDADVSVFSDQNQTNLIDAFPGLTKGDLRTLSANTLPQGAFGPYVYFRLDYTSGEACSIRVFSRCPSNAWPGALEDLQILGKSFGDITIFAYTSSENNTMCTIADIEQDWHVGGNIVAPDKMSLGTINDESVSIITNDTEVGIITNTGEFGIGVNPPEALLHVGGNARVNETMDIFGITTIHNSTSSSSNNDGERVVNGGVGIGENKNIGSDIDITGMATVGNNLTVEAPGTTRLLNNSQSTSTATGALVVSGGTGISRNLWIGENADIAGTTTIGNSLIVETAGVTRLLNNSQSNSINTGALRVTGGVGVGRNLNVGENLDVDGNTHINGITRIGTLNMPAFAGGEPTANYHLFVAGGILTEEVLVNVGWADFVFEKDYKLRSLEETASYIEENGHLPDIPSAEEIERQGLPLASNAVNQQIKIEEIFLHLIELNNQIKALQAENEQLKNLLLETRKE